MSRLQARNVSLVPGQVLMSLTAQARSVDGREWPEGTEYTPRSAGASSTYADNGTEQSVNIGAEVVVFAWDQAGRQVPSAEI